MDTPFTERKDEYQWINLLLDWVKEYPLQMTVVGVALVIVLWKGTNARYTSASAGGHVITGKVKNKGEKSFVRNIYCLFFNVLKNVTKEDPTKKSK